MTAPRPACPAEVVLETVPCPFGCAGGDETVLVGHDRLHGLPGAFQVVKCRACGLLRTNPRPTRKTIGFYYPEDYGPHLRTVETAAATPPRERPRWKRLGLRAHRYLFYEAFRFNHERFPPLPPGRMLEVGCATGAFLHAMAERGWEVEGLESSERAAREARSHGHIVYLGTLEEAPDPTRLYDLVVGWMVLEHLHNPLLGLEKLRRWVRPGGWLALSVPNAGSLEFRWFREAWYALSLPTHLYHFTPRTLTRLLSECGWRAERIFHQRLMSNLLASMGYVLEDRGYRNFITRALVTSPVREGRLHYRLYPLAWMLSLFGQTGRMTVWARKPND